MKPPSCNHWNIPGSLKKFHFHRVCFPKLVLHVSSKCFLTIMNYIYILLWNGRGDSTLNIGLNFKATTHLSSLFLGHMLDSRGTMWFLSWVLEHMTNFSPLSGMMEGAWEDELWKCYWQRRPWCVPSGVLSSIRLVQGIILPSYHYLIPAYSCAGPRGSALLYRCSLWVKGRHTPWKRPRM